MVNKFTFDAVHLINEPNIADQRLRVTQYVTDLAQRPYILQNTNADILKCAKSR